METTYSYARAHLAEIWDRVIDDAEPVVLTRRGSEDIALVSAAELRSMVETLYLLASPANGIRLLTAIQRAQGRALPPTSLRALREELGLHDGSEVTERAPRRGPSS